MLVHCCVPAGGGRRTETCCDVSESFSDCCGPGFGRRRYVSTPEKIEAIEKYIEELKKEIQGAEEQIERLKSA